MTADPQTVGSVGVPERAAGLLLLGEQAGSGYRETPALVRRADGQTVQLTRLLYLVLEAVDGRRTTDEIARAVSAAYGRAVSAEQVNQLLRDRLLPLGLLRLPDGPQPQVARRDPLLGLRFRFVVSDPGVTRRITAPFAALFMPVVVVLAVAAFAFVSWWVLSTGGWRRRRTTRSTVRDCCCSCSPSPCCRRASTSSVTRPPAGTAARHPARWAPACT